MQIESVSLYSLGDELAGNLYLPASSRPAPALIVCHGAGEYKENYAEMCETLAQRGIASLALDMHGHGASGGERFFLRMSEWVPDIRAAVGFLSTHPRVDANKIAAFGLSSGGTAILEAGVVEPRLKALVALDATVHNSLPAATAIPLKIFLALGKLKRGLTGKTLRLPLAKMSAGPKMASDPEINARIMSNPRATEAFMSYPLPGAEEAFFVDTINRVSQIAAPTLVIWGEDDNLDPTDTARLLLATLTCKKRLEIVAGNGHVGHLDRNRAKVFALTADWLLENLTGEPVGQAANSPEKPPVQRAMGAGETPTRPAAGTPAQLQSGVKTICGDAAKNFDQQQKWELLSPFLKQHGREALAYATLQAGMEYFIDETGYIAFTTVQHPVFAPKPKRIVLSDPVCARGDIRELVERFLADNPRAAFGVISEFCAEVLRPMGFKVNGIGYEPELTIQTYNTKGNWKELDLIKRARNEAKREGIVIREETPESLDQKGLGAVSAKWIGTKKISDREIWIYARRPVFGPEPDVRKFVAYDKEGQVAGFAFYDPMYRAGQVYGYSANIVRCDEQRFGRLATAIHMEAVEKFKVEGKEVLNLLLAPFVELDRAKYNDDLGAKWFFKLAARFGNNIYNFKGLSFHKSKYRGVDKNLYYASNSFWPSNDIYLAFLSADITRSYFTTLGQLLQGMLSPSAWRSKRDT
jgi:alpha-beta hydrolase superfamily lysophospholipase